MAESTSVALAAAPIPSSAEISRAEKLVRERFLHDGEDPAVALAPVSAEKPRRSRFWPFALGFVFGALALFCLALIASLSSF